MKPSINIVLGLGFGDEGKGLMTDYLCSQFHPSDSMVVRFSGGHQAGHTVCLPDGKRHVFSQLGSGSFRGIPTFYSKYCTFSPIDFVNERDKFFKTYGKIPKFYLDGEAPVTTHYDIYYNRALEKVNNHGSCGVGFAATIERHEGPVKIFARDIKYPFILKEKLIQVKRYYENKNFNPIAKSMYLSSDFDYGEGVFLDSVFKSSLAIDITNEYVLLKKNIVFEGSQGILLDMDSGFFPNVTRSNTTSKNAMEIIRRNDLELPKVYYMSRAYQTRHGNGWMTNEGTIKVDNHGETNVHNEWQGNLRTGILDLDLLKYSIDCDLNFSKLHLTKSHNLVITCFDQIKEMSVTLDKKKHNISVWEDDLISHLPLSIEEFYVSSSPYSSNLKKII
jgi:adenylosuccinate synthase